MKAQKLNDLILQCGYRLSEETRKLWFGQSVVECTWTLDNSERNTHVKFAFAEETGQVFDSLEMVRQEDQLLRSVLDTLPDLFFLVDTGNYRIIA